MNPRAFGSKYRYFITFVTCFPTHIHHSSQHHHKDTWWETSLSASVLFNNHCANNKQFRKQWSYRKHGEKGHCEANDPVSVLVYLAWLAKKWRTWSLNQWTLYSWGHFLKISRPQKLIFEYDHYRLVGGISDNFFKVKLKIHSQHRHIPALESTCSVIIRS